ncbi:hypothetical protein BH24GEM3_BH24GEM3_02110 [soil metagenome]
MRIRIIAADPTRPAWLNEHVGEEFEAHGSPGKYVVQLPIGNGLVPFAFAEWLDPPTIEPDPPPYLEPAAPIAPVRGTELAALEVRAWHAAEWPKQEDGAPVRLGPEEVTKLFEGPVNARFYSTALEDMLRLVWTCRRLKAENEELRKSLGVR